MYDSRLQRRLNRNESTVRIADALGALLLSSLLILAVMALFYVQGMIWKFCAMLGFTIIFSVSLTVFTDAKKIEVYSATAAFAAVEVVFIVSTSSASQVITNQVITGFS